MQKAKSLYENLKLCPRHVMGQRLGVLRPVFPKGVSINYVKLRAKQTNPLISEVSLRMQSLSLKYCRTLVLKLQLPSHETAVWPVYL